MIQPDLKPTKFILPAIIVILLIAVGTLYIQMNSLRHRYVFVDAQRLLSNYDAMKDARLAFESKTDVWRNNLDSLRRELEINISNLNTAAPKLSGQELVKRQREIQSKQEEYAAYEEAISRKMHEEDNQLSADVLEKMNGYIKRFGKERGYSIIMAATNTGNIVYADDQADITDEVLAGLNAEYKTK